MIHPPLKELLKYADCRYTLVVMVSKRARELVQSGNGESGLAEKPVNLAVNEIYAGNVVYTDLVIK